MNRFIQEIGKGFGSRAKRWDSWWSATTRDPLAICTRQSVSSFLTRFVVLSLNLLDQELAKYFAPILATASQEACPSVPFALARLLHFETLPATQNVGVTMRPTNRQIMQREAKAGKRGWGPGFICYSLDALTNGGRSEDGKVGTILDLRGLFPQTQSLGQPCRRCTESFHNGQFLFREQGSAGRQSSEK